MSANEEAIGQAQEPITGGKLKGVDSERIVFWNMLLMRELTRRVEELSQKEDDSDKITHLVSAAYEGTRSWYDLFMKRPALFAKALKERTNCSIPCPVNKHARDKVIEYMSKHTKFNLKQKKGIDIYKPAYRILILHINHIESAIRMGEAMSELGNEPDEPTRGWMNLPILSSDKSARLKWFQAIWCKIQSETDGNPQSVETYKELVPRCDALEDDPECRAIYQKIYKSFQSLVSQETQQ